MTHRAYDTIIIGAGLAGLSAAQDLHARNIDFLLLEATDRVGGRVKTDHVEGFLLDHGFQILLKGYPEAQKLLDYSALDLQPFFNGSLVWMGDSLQKIADPWRHPVEGLQSIYNKVGSLKDKLKVAELRETLLHKSLSDIMASPESTTQDYLVHFGFSSQMIESFFRPFFAGIFLEPELVSSSRFFQFIFRMFSVDSVALPAKGMGSIPQQLADQLPPDRLRLNAPVVSVDTTGTPYKTVVLEGGETLQARTLLIATDGYQAAQLLPQLEKPAFNPVYCLYFAAKQAPVTEPILTLNGSGKGVVNNLCVPNRIAPSYAPAGQDLISVTVLGHQDNPDALFQRVQAELAGWFGETVAEWRPLKQYFIPRALPRIAVPEVSLQPQANQISPGVYTCGDYLATPSLNGAMESGLRAAKAIQNELTDLKTAL